MAIGMGGNVGDRLAALRRAVAAFDAHPEVDVVAVSPVYETEALVPPGAAPQADHLNAVAVVETTLAPFAMLRVLHGIERAAGRDPFAPRWSPRPLDQSRLARPPPSHRRCRRRPASLCPSHSVSLATQ